MLLRNSTVRNVIEEGYCGLGVRWNEEYCGITILVEVQ
jgi:hypothetical protein